MPKAICNVVETYGCMGAVVLNGNGGQKVRTSVMHPVTFASPSHAPAPSPVQLKHMAHSLLTQVAYLASFQGCRKVGHFSYMLLAAVDNSGVLRYLGDGSQKCNALNHDTKRALYATSETKFLCVQSPANPFLLLPDTFLPSEFHEQRQFFLLGPGGPAAAGRTGFA